MSKLRTGGLALAVLAVGAVVGAAAEQLVLRRVLPASDPESAEALGSITGELVDVTSFDGTVISAQTWGPEDAPAVIFLHGFTLTQQVWHYQVRDLVADGRFRVVTYDARGHGKSGPPPGSDIDTEYSTDTMARDLHAVLLATTKQSAIVVGHSMGGMTVQALAAFGHDYPDELDDDPYALVRGLVLLNTTFTWSIENQAINSRLQRVVDSGLSVWESFASDARRLDRLRMPVNDLLLLGTRLGFGSNPSAAHVAFTARMIAACSSETIAAAVRGLANFENQEHLADMDVPVLIVAGGRDLVTPVNMSRRMAKHIPDAEVVTLPGAGHMAMLERHERFSELVVAFAEKVLLAKRKNQ